MKLTLLGVVAILGVLAAVLLVVLTLGGKEEGVVAERLTSCH